MAELQAEIVIRLMSDGKVGVRYTPCGPMFLYGMLENAKDVIREKYAGMSKPMIEVPAAQLPDDLLRRIKPEDVPPMMGNGK